MACEAVHVVNNLGCREFGTVYSDGAFQRWLQWYIALIEGQMRKWADDSSHA